jgi:hypothetical protein
LAAGQVSPLERMVWVQFANRFPSTPPNNGPCAAIRRSQARKRLGARYGGYLWYQRQLMDREDKELMEIARHEPYAALGMDTGPRTGLRGHPIATEQAEF